MPKKPLIRYTSRSFQTIKRDLVEHAQRYYPNFYNDFSENSFGSMVFDSVSYVGDMLSFYLDYQTNESFLETATSLDNLRKLANQMGYNYYGNPAVYGTATFYCRVPANSLGLGPDVRFIPVLEKGTKIRTTDGASFRTTQDIDFNNPSVDVVAARFDETTGKPTDYALRTFCLVRSGVEYFVEREVTTSTDFLRIRVGDQTINEILTVFDSEGHQYYEVDNLSQEVVYLQQSNSNVHVDEVPSILKPFIASRRFVVEQDETGTYLQFGFGSETEIDKFGLTDPSQVVLKMTGKNYITDTAFDPNRFLGTDKFGISPRNTTLLITYGGNNSNSLNVSINGFSEVSQPLIKFPADTSNNSVTQNEVTSTVEVSNDAAIINDNTLPTADEIRYRSYAVYSAQNRVVTKNDYEAYVYQMPTSLGRVTRVSVVNDPSGINKRLAMYVISKDNDGYFVNTNGTVKSNLKVWLNKNRMMTDQVDVFDAAIINIGFNYKYTTESGFSKTSVQADVNAAVRKLFAEKQYIGEPVYITTIYQTVNRVQGVVDTLKVTPLIKQSANYSNLGLEIDDVLSKDGTFLKCPKNCVFEIKYPDQDLKGTIL
jgi:hypothetical protein